ncbi:hypothetical protein [Chitinimonas sp. BJB300]|uniref:hypothetical protein n=1 Tax=Chitinimonas sp. BJB300 TaxID=1559339 RepID=UPI001111A3D2|nr:hypothetical protein [Chitinimonas sp. BJB300]TSJ85211.1 hypothetical protein FG002_018095 [Chitinimonas sp. BJB300]
MKYLIDFLYPAFSWIAFFSLGIIAVESKNYLLMIGLSLGFPGMAQSQWRNVVKPSLGSRYWKFSFGLTIGAAAAYYIFALGYLLRTWM